MRLPRAPASGKRLPASVHRLRHSRTGGRENRALPRVRSGDGPSAPALQWQQVPPGVASGEPSASPPRTTQVLTARSEEKSGYSLENRRSWSLDLLTAWIFVFFLHKEAHFYPCLLLYTRSLRNSWALRLVSHRLPGCLNLYRHYCVSSGCPS